MFTPMPWWAHVEHGRYLAPQEPGISAEIVEESLARWAFPDGPGGKRSET